MKTNEDEGQSKKPTRKKVPMKKSKVEDDKAKMKINEGKGQSKKPTKKKMPMKKSNEEDANEKEEHKFESLIPAITLYEFFICDYDDHIPSIGDSSDNHNSNAFIPSFNSK
ncbi:hypothetical protein HN51_046627 [Arachis hypogaea]